MRRFSVVIPVWNADATIARALNSVFSQTNPALEVICVDDGSTDRSAEVIQQHPLAGRIRLIKTQNNGPSLARNIGVSAARGGHVAFLDADDYWTPDHLRSLASLVAEFPGAVLYCSGYQRICAGGSGQRETKRLGRYKTRSYGLQSYLLARILGRRIAWTSAVAVSKGMFMHVGGFDARFKHGEDQGLWLKLACQGRVAKSSLTTAFYVESSIGLSSQLVDEEDGCMRVIKEHFSIAQLPLLTRLLLAEFFNRYAVLHAGTALRYGDAKVAGKMLDMMFPTIVFLPRAFAYRVVVFCRAKSA